jgi:hypothetical protein
VATQDQESAAWQKLHAAIQQFHLDIGETGVVTAWTLIDARLDNDGADLYTVNTTSAENQPIWQSMGLIEHARHHMVVAIDEEDE